MSTGEKLTLSSIKTVPVFLQFFDSIVRLPAYFSESEAVLFLTEPIFLGNLEKLKSAKLIRVSLLKSPVSEVETGLQDTAPPVISLEQSDAERMDDSYEYVYCVDCGKKFKALNFQSKCRVCRMKAIQDEDITSAFNRNISPKRTGRQMVYRYYGPSGDSL